MPKKTTVLPTSIRQGKLQPSQRYDNIQAKTIAMKTNWRLGIDPPMYESTSHADNKHFKDIPPEILALRQPRVVKNSSDKVLCLLYSLREKCVFIPFLRRFHSLCLSFTGHNRQ